MDDLVDTIKQWVAETFESLAPTSREIDLMVSTFMVAINLAERHPEYIAALDWGFYQTSADRIAGGNVMREVLDAAAEADGDTRSASEMLADALAEELPLDKLRELQQGP